MRLPSASDLDPRSVPGQYAQELSQRANGPHDDQATAQVAGLAAEAIRYLSYAATHGGMTEPATVYAVTGELSAAAYRLPQFLTQVSGRLTAEISPGRITGDRPAWQLTDDTRTLYSEAAGHAAALADALTSAHNLTSALRASAPHPRGALPDDPCHRQLTRQPTPTAHTPGSPATT